MKMPPPWPQLKPFDIQITFAKTEIWTCSQCGFMEQRSVDATEQLLHRKIRQTSSGPLEIWCGQMRRDGDQVQTV